MSKRLLIYDTTAPEAIVPDSQTRPMGTAELEQQRLAEGLAERGYDVTLATSDMHLGVQHKGVRYMCRTYAIAAHRHIPYDVLITQRATPLPPLLESVPKIFTRMMDLPSDQRFPDPAKSQYVCVTEWHKGLFGQERTAVIPCRVEASVSREKIAASHIFASHPGKGLNETLDVWRQMKMKGYIEPGAFLRIAIPWNYERDIEVGHGSYGARKPKPAPKLDEFECRKWHIDQPVLCNPEQFTRMIAESEMLFYVNAFPEGYCCTLALALESGCRVHVLALPGAAGMREVVESYGADPRCVTEDIAEFVRVYRGRTNGERPLTNPLTRDAWLDKWEALWW